MPVYIWQDDALDLMAQVEGGELGEEWKRHQEAMGKVSFKAFYDEWVAYGAHKDSFDEIIVTVDGMGAIYGWYGWNRYAVRGSGRLVFLEQLSRDDECTARARKLGFDVH